MKLTWWRYGAARLLDAGPMLTAPADGSCAGSRSAWDSAEPDLVAVGVDVGGLAHAARVRLPLGGLQSPLGYLGHEGVEVINDDGVHGVAGVFGPLADVHRPVLGQLPHGLRVVGEERRRGAEQPLVPGQRRCVIADRYPCEQVDGHDDMLRTSVPADAAPPRTGGFGCALESLHGAG